MHRHKRLIPTHRFGWWLRRFSILAVLLGVPFPGWSAQAGNWPPAEGRYLLAQAPPSPPVAQAEAAQHEEEEEEEVARVPLAIVQRGGLLLRPDQLVVDTNVAYSFTTGTRLIVTGFSILPLIILGNLEAEKTTTQVFSQSLGFRYGLLHGLQVDFRVPWDLIYVTRLRVSTDQAGQVEDMTQGFGLGDITFGLSHQILYETGWLPDMTVRVGARAPTGRSQFDIFESIAEQGSLLSIEEFLIRLNSEGPALGSGRWSIDTSLTAVKALDPAILFSTFGYSLTPASRKTLIQITSQLAEGGIALRPTPISASLGAVSTLRQSLGMAISLNNQLSMNLSFNNSVTFRTKVDGQEVPGSDIHVGQFNMGFNLTVHPRVSINFAGAIGLTPDAPGMGFSLTVPVSYTNVLRNTMAALKKMVKRVPAPQGLRNQKKGARGE